MTDQTLTTLYRIVIKLASSEIPIGKTLLILTSTIERGSANAHGT